MGARTRSAKTKKDVKRKRKQSSANVYRKDSVVVSARLPRETADRLKVVLQAQNVTLPEWIAKQLAGNGGEIPDLKAAYDTGLRRGLEAALDFAAALFDHAPENGLAKTLAEEVLDNVRLTTEALNEHGLSEIPPSFIARTLLEDTWRRWARELEGK